jgi:hypothetical protein
MPIVAPQGVIDTIFGDDPAKEQILRPMFGDEWEAQLTGSVSPGWAARVLRTLGRRPEATVFVPFPKARNQAADFLTTSAS